MDKISPLSEVLLYTVVGVVYMHDICSVNTMAILHRDLRGVY